MNRKLLIKTGMFVIVVTVVVLNITTPVLATQDDTFVQYVLSAGFTQATLPVTYFTFGFIGYENVFAWLYRHFPHFNCVTVFYLIVHAVSAVIIIYHLAAEKKFLFGAAYMLFFFVPLIIRLSFTTVSAHAIISGFVICLYLIQKQKTPSYITVLLLSFWFIGALLLRIHIVFPLLLMFLPFFLLIRNTKLLQRLFVMILFTAVTTISGLIIHEKYYRSNVPDWMNINATTNAFYQLGNKGYDVGKIAGERDTQKRADYSMIRNGFLYDDKLMDANTLRAMQQATRYENIWQNLNIESLYFLFTDMKQYLLIILMLVSLLLVSKTEKRYRHACFASIAVALAVSFYLIVFMRLPERVWFGVFLLLFLLLSFTLPPLKQTRLARLRAVALTATITVALGIQAIFLFKTNSNNEKSTESFECATRFVSNNPDTLFVEYHESFPFNHFPALASPQDHPISNVLFPFFFNTELRNNLVKQLNIRRVSDAITLSNNIMLIGTPDEDLQNYLELIQHKKISFKKINVSGSCLNLFTVSSK